MPDKTGMMSDDEMEKAAKWLRENARNPCSACGHNQWDMQRHVIEIKARAIASLGKFDYYPALLLTCKNCGNCRFHMAVKAGVQPYKE